MTLDHARLLEESRQGLTMLRLFLVMAAEKAGL
jgi:hypothetical protein